MAPFVTTNRAPGVYIEEVQEAGPIAGVGTSTAAFIGPAEHGPINTPTFLTNFTQFQNAFGDYIPAPMVYVTHAVRGFFDNGVHHLLLCARWHGGAGVAHAHRPG